MKRKHVCWWFRCTFSQRKEEVHEKRVQLMLGITAICRIKSNRSCWTRNEGAIHARGKLDLLERVKSPPFVQQIVLVS
jgi:hypothetical protein